MDTPSYGSNGSKPGPSVADMDNDGNTEILWTLRDYWPDYNGSPSTVWCFNGKNLDGTNMSGFPQRAIAQLSNAFEVPFVLADLDNNGVLEAFAAHITAMPQILPHFCLSLFGRQIIHTVF
jgi:hypothetical protein